MVPPAKWCAIVPTAWLILAKLEVGHETKHTLYKQQAVIGTLACRLNKLYSINQEAISFYARTPLPTPPLAPPLAPCCNNKSLVFLVVGVPLLMALLPASVAAARAGARLPVPAGSGWPVLRPS